MPDPYRALAPFYDEAMGWRPKDTKLLRELIQDHHPFAKTILELACGTGSLLQHFSSRYRVSGLDHSATMLARAKRKIPRVTFYRQNMTTFHINESFDVIFCAFNSLNHVSTFTGWKRTFERAAHHLNPFGIFIFEVNTPKRLKVDPEEPWVVHPFGRHLISVRTKYQQGLTSSLIVNVFERTRDNRYRLHESRIREIAFPRSRIRKALSPWFSKIEVVDPNRRHPSRHSERLYFICHKKATSLDWQA